MIGTLTTNGDTLKATISQPTVRATGTWSSGTMTWYYKDASGAWLAISDATMTADAMYFIDFKFPTTIKGTLSGAGSPSITWEIR